MRKRNHEENATTKTRRHEEDLKSLYKTAIGNPSGGCFRGITKR